MAHVRNLGILLVAGLLLSGCALNPYADLPHGYYSGKGPLTADQIWVIDNSDYPRCKDWAENTNPTNRDIAVAYGLNALQGGFIGGGLGQPASALVAGASVTLRSALAAGTYYGIAVAPLGAIQGQETNGYIKHADTEWCLAASAGGYYFYSKDAADKIRSDALKAGWKPPVPAVTKSSVETRNLPPPPPH